VPTVGQSTESRHRLNYNRADFEKLRCEFSQCDWAGLFGQCDVNTCYERFLNVYQRACAKFVPRTKARPVRRDKWISAEITDMLKEKRKSWFEMGRKDRKNRAVRTAYNKLCKRTKKAIKKAVRDYERDLASRAKRDPKLVYAYINSKRNTKEAIRVLEDESGQQVVERNDICNLLNKQFGSVFIREGDGQLPAFKSRTNARLHAESVATAISREKVIKFLAKLCPS